MKTSNVVSSHEESLKQWLPESLTVHVDSPESSEATLSPFSRRVTRVSGTFRTTWVAACVLLNLFPPKYEDWVGVEGGSKTHHYSDSQCWLKNQNSKRLSIKYSFLPNLFHWNPPFAPPKNLPSLTNHPPKETCLQSRPSLREKEQLLSLFREKRLLFQYLS